MRHARYSRIPVCLCLGLAACATPAEQAAQAQRDMDRQMQIFGPACEHLGYRRDTEGWRHCVLHLGKQDALERYGIPRTTTCFGDRSFLQCSAF